jgi:hypothetical protein
VLSIRRPSRWADFPVRPIPAYCGARIRPNMPEVPAPVPLMEPVVQVETVYVGERADQVTAAQRRGERAGSGNARGRQRDVSTARGRPDRLHSVSPCLTKTSSPMPGIIIWVSPRAALP